MAVSRSSTMTVGPALVWIELRSSLGVTSLTRCSRFDLPVDPLEGKQGVTSPTSRGWLVRP